MVLSVVLLLSVGWSLSLLSSSCVPPTVSVVGVLLLDLALRLGFLLGAWVVGVGGCSAADWLRACTTALAASDAPGLWVLELVDSAGRLCVLGVGGISRNPVYALRVDHELFHHSQLSFAIIKSRIVTSVTTRKIRRRS